MGEGLGKLIKTVGGGLTAFFGFVTGVVGFIRLVQGDVGLLTIVLSGIGMGILILTCAYIYSSTTFEPKIRRLAQFGLVAISLFVAVGIGGWQYYQALPIGI